MSTYVKGMGLGITHQLCSGTKRGVGRPIVLNSPSRAPLENRSSSNRRPKPPASETLQHPVPSSKAFPYPNPKTLSFLQPQAPSQATPITTDHTQSSRGPAR